MWNCNIANARQVTITMGKYEEKEGQDENKEMRETILLRCYVGDASSRENSH